MTYQYHVWQITLTIVGFWDGYRFERELHAASEKVRA